MHGQQRRRRGLVGDENVAQAGADGAPDDATPVRDSLTFLRGRLDTGAGEDAQQLFPEGYYFAHALYGLAWTDLAAAGHADVAAARREARWALDRLESPAGRQPFSASLRPSYGIFYAGWTLLLRAQLAALDDDAEEDRRVRDEADAIAGAFEASLDAGGSPFLVAYPGQSWPVDNVVAIAALRQADRATGSDHGPLIARWLARAQELVDPATRLLPHQTDPATGRVVEGSRGTSQSIIQRLWPIVDPSTAPDVYRRFHDRFVQSSLGWVGVREYPTGIDGPGDVDSGPVVLGFAASSTAVSIGAARANGDPDLAVAILHEADVYGMPLTWSGERRYLGGVLPVGDAFMAWARAAPLAPATDQPSPTAWWPMHLLLPWTVVGGAWLLVVRRRRSGAPRGARAVHQKAASPAPPVPAGRRP